MIYEKHLSEPWFSLVKSGKKTVEGRLIKSDFAKMVIGDIIKFYNKVDKSDIFQVEITKIRKYNTFKEMITKERLKNVLPTIKKIEDGVKIYHDIYNEEDEKKYNVVAIRMVLI